MDVHTMFTGGKGRMSFTDRQISVQFKQRDRACVDRHLAKKNVQRLNDNICSDVGF